MKSNTVIIGTATKMFEQITAKVEEIKTDHEELIKSIHGAPVETALTKVETIVKCIKLAVEGVDVDGVGLPEFLTRIRSYDEAELETISLTVSSKLKAERRFKQKFDISVDDEFVDNVSKAFTDTMFHEYYIREATENLALVNEKIAEINAANGIDKTIEFVVNDDEGRVMYIDDSKVVLKAELSKALDSSRMGILLEGEEYEQLVHDEAVKAYVGGMQDIKITPQILKARISVVEELLDLHTKKRVGKIIREGISKQAKYIADGKEGIGYFNEKVDDVDVFAIIKKAADGSMEYVLSPFDVSELVSVDTDVISIVKG